MDPNASLAQLLNPESTDIERVEACVALLSWSYQDGYKPAKAHLSVGAIQAIMARVLDRMEDRH